MEIIPDLIAAGAWLCLGLVLLGLWRPWLVLWWLDYQNRLRVLLYYGVPGTLLAVIHLLLQ